MRRALALFLAALAAPLAAQAPQRLLVADFPTCTDGRPFLVWAIDGTGSSDCATGGSSTEVLCLCKDGAYSAASAGGITSVWNDSAGDVSALVAAAGDSLDCGSGDACSPATRSTSLPGTCTEGQWHQDTNSGGSELYHCVATDLWVKLATTLNALDEEYSPDRAPDTLHGCSDEFTGGAGSWNWGNQGTAFATAQLDTLHFGDATAAGGNQRRAYWNGCTVPTTTFVLSGKFLSVPTGNSASVGLALLLAGTEGTPTSIAICDTFTTTPGLRAGTLTSYTATISQSGSTRTVPWSSGGALSTPLYFQMRYDDTADTISCWASFDGFGFSQVGNTLTSITSDPLSIGLFVNPFTAVESHWYWFRTRTDSTGITAPFPVGR